MKTAVFITGDGIGVTVTNVDEVASGNAAKFLQIEDLSSFTFMAVSLVDPKQW